MYNIIMFCFVIDICFLPISKKKKKKKKRRKNNSHAKWFDVNDISTHTRLRLYMVVSCESGAKKKKKKKTSCDFFRKDLFELNTLPAGMYTSWSISVYNCHPIVPNLVPQLIAEVDTILFKVTNE